ncbi:MAG: prepilin-type N-terminal cleavage/methylation domain-containing protein [Candidatus Omnitrophota bacterium]
MRNGFTLLEVLIGITIFAIVAASVYTSLALGIKVFKQEEARDELMQEAMVTIGEVQRCVRCAFINPENENIKFLGTKDSLDLFSVNQEGDVENVSFYLEASDGDPGVKALFRVTRPYLQSENEEIPGNVELIHEGIEKFELSYFDAKDQKWYEEWPEELTLPSQIKLDIGFKAANEKQSGIELAKYMNIPLAKIINFSGPESE